MSNKNWSVFLGLLQSENMDCLLFLLSVSMFSRVLKKRKKGLCYKLSQIEFESAIQNMERIPLSLIRNESFLDLRARVRKMCLGKGERPGATVNVKEQ